MPRAPKCSASSRRISTAAYSRFRWSNGAGGCWPSIGWRMRRSRASGPTAWWCGSASAQPVAFVLLRRAVLLVDAQGVLLDPPPQAQFSFPGAERRARGRDRSRSAASRCAPCCAFEEDLGPLAKDVSEVNAADPENLRVWSQVDNRAVELMPWATVNFARRYQNFLNHYAEIRRTSPEVKSFDLRLDDRITAKGSLSPWR